MESLWCAAFMVIVWILSVPRWVIRLVLYFFLIEYLYDGLWLFIHWTSWWDKDINELELEVGVMRIALIATIVAMIIRIFVIYCAENQN